MLQISVQRGDEEGLKSHTSNIMLSMSVPYFIKGQMIKAIHHDPPQRKDGYWLPREKKLPQ